METIALLAAIVFVLMSVVGSGFGSSNTISELNKAVPPPMVVTQQLLARGGDGMWLVNGITLGQTFGEIRVGNPEFPDAGTKAALDSGAELNLIRYRDSRYYFQGPKVVAIGTDSAGIEGPRIGSSKSHVAAVLGDPLSSHILNTDGKKYYVGIYRDQETATQRWRVVFNPTTGTATEITLVGSGNLP